MYLPLLCPCRAAKAAGAAKAGGKARGGAAAVAAEEPPPSMDDLLPRADISGQITGDLVGRMSSSVWKERKEAWLGVDKYHRELKSTAAGRF